jgi:hypothetical protein
VAVQLAKVTQTRHGGQASKLFQRYAHQRCEDASAGDKRATQRA